MQPSSSSNNKYTTPKSISSNEVIWNGPSLDCIGLCVNDTISDVQAKIAVKLCEFMEEFDLTEVDLKCLYDACEICPDPDKNITNVFRLLINAFCDLKAKVDQLGGGSSTDEDVFQVNMRCLAIVDGAGNILNDNTNRDIIQSIIDEVCTHRNQIALLNNKVNSLQQQIDDIPQQEEEGLPDVDSACLFTGLRSLDVAHDLLDTAFCQNRTAVGLPSTIIENISKQCTDLTVYLPNPAFTASPSNLAQSMGNVWVILCDILGRVKAIEDNCCKVTCDEVKVGFGVRLTDDREVATLVFNYGTGTQLPVGFTDCGSVLTVTDTAGNIITFNPEIENNAEIEVDLTGLDPNLDYIFSIDTCISNGNLTCKKCLTKTVTYKSTCAYCEFTAAGPKEGGVAVIFYTENNFPRTASLQVGQTIVLPRAIKITSVATDGSVSVVTSCPDFEEALSNTEPYICAVVSYSLDLNSGSNPWDIGGTYIDSVGYGDVLYPLSGGNLFLQNNLFNNNLGPNAPLIASQVKEAAPDGLILYSEIIKHGTVGDRLDVRLLMKVPQSALSRMFILFQPSGGTEIAKVRIYPIECSTGTCCPGSV